MNFCVSNVAPSIEQYSRDHNCEDSYSYEYYGTKDHKVYAAKYLLIWSGCCSSFIDRSGRPSPVADGMVNVTASKHLLFQGMHIYSVQ